MEKAKKTKKRKKNETKICVVVFHFHSQCFLFAFGIRNGIFLSKQPQKMRILRRDDRVRHSPSHYSKTMSFHKMINHKNSTNISPRRFIWSVLVEFRKLKSKLNIWLYIFSTRVTQLISL